MVPLKQKGFNLMNDIGMTKQQYDKVMGGNAARLLKKYAARLPKLTQERRRRIVSAVASDLERKTRAKTRAA